MPFQPTPEAIEKSRDPRVVRSPGQTLEQMLLEQERELRSDWEGDSARRTGVRMKARPQNDPGSNVGQG